MLEVQTFGKGWLSVTWGAGLCEQAHALLHCLSVASPVGSQNLYSFFFVKGGFRILLTPVWLTVDFLRVF